MFNRLRDCDLNGEIYPNLHKLFTPIDWAKPNKQLVCNAVAEALTLMRGRKKLLVWDGKGGLVQYPIVSDVTDYGQERVTINDLFRFNRATLPYRNGLLGRKEKDKVTSWVTWKGRLNWGSEQETKFYSSADVQNRVMKFLGVKKRHETIRVTQDLKGTVLGFGEQEPYKLDPNSHLEVIALDRLRRNIRHLFDDHKQTFATPLRKCEGESIYRDDWEGGIQEELVGCFGDLIRQPTLESAVALKRQLLLTVDRALILCSPLPCFTIDLLGNCYYSHRLSEKVDVRCEKISELEILSTDHLVDFIESESRYVTVRCYDKSEQVGDFYFPVDSLWFKVPKNTKLEATYCTSTQEFSLHLQPDDPTTIDFALQSLAKEKRCISVLCHEEPFRSKGTRGSFLRRTKQKHLPVDKLWFTVPMGSEKQVHATYIESTGEFTLKITTK